MDPNVEILKILKNLVIVVGRHKNIPLNKTRYATVISNIGVAIENIKRLNYSTVNIQEYLSIIRENILNNTFSSYLELKVQIQTYLPERVKMDIDISPKNIREAIVEFGQELTKL